MFSDTREPLAEVAAQLLVVLLEQNSEQTAPVTETSSEEGVLEQTPEVGLLSESLFRKKWCNKEDTCMLSV